MLAKRCGRGVLVVQLRGARELPQGELDVPELVVGDARVHARACVARLERAGAQEAFERALGRAALELEHAQAGERHVIGRVRRDRRAKGGIGIGEPSRECLERAELALVSRARGVALERGLQVLAARGDRLALRVDHADAVPGTIVGGSLHARRLVAAARRDRLAARTRDVGRGELRLERRRRS
jgi:hypothetical protein